MNGERVEGAAKAAQQHLPDPFAVTVGGAGEHDRRSRVTCSDAGGDLAMEGSELVERARPEPGMVRFVPCLVRGDSVAEVAGEPLRERQCHPRQS